MAVKIQIRRGTAAAWTSADPTLATGERGLETDTGKYKVGDGSTSWTSLSYETMIPSSHSLAGSEHSSDTLTNLNSKLDVTLIPDSDSRLSDSRTCDNTFDTASTSRTNLDVYSTSEVDSKVVGLWDDKGGYDAATNTPDLDTTPIAGIKKGDLYLISVAGTFFTEAMSAGDFIVAKQDSPTTLAHWTTAQKNLEFGTGAGEICEGDDSRLSDDRTASGVKTATTTVSVSAATAPSVGQVLKATSSTVATWQNETAGTSEVDAQESGATAQTSTTSASFVDLDSCLITTSNTASKKYMVVFTGQTEASSANKRGTIQLVIDGVAQSKTVRNVDFSSGGAAMVMSTNIITASLATGKIIKVQFKVDSGTIYFDERCLTVHGVS